MLLLALAGPVVAQEPSCVPGEGGLERVCYTRVPGTPTYGHTILGATPEWNRLVAHPSDGPPVSVTPEDAATGIFEDVAPRLYDVTGDGRFEAIVVETSPRLGARVAVYTLRSELRLLAATPYIGQRNRWYAPIGAADLDGDGRVEIAFVDRPHLARVLRVYRYEDGALTEVAAAAGVTNHRIGEPDIAGGIRTCGQGPEMIVANADWTRLLAVTFVDGALQARDIGPHGDRDSFAAAMICD